MFYRRMWFCVWARLDRVTEGTSLHDGGYGVAFGLGYGSLEDRGVGVKEGKE